MNLSRARRFAASVAPLFVGLALLTAGCGSSNTHRPGVATVASKTATASTSASATAAPDEQALKFARCMREHGVQMSDPSGAGGGAMIQIGDGTDPHSATFVAAQRACQAFAPSLGGISKENAAEMQDQLAAMAKCMRGKGFDVPDPVIAGAGQAPSGGGSGMGRPAFDPNDPKFKAAETACGKTAGMPGLGGSGASGAASAG